MPDYTFNIAWSYDRQCWSAWVDEDWIVPEEGLGDSPVTALKALLTIIEQKR
jgi:hypothetical protein